MTLYIAVPYGLKIWFPYYHKDTIEFYSRQNQLDPLLVASIIRAESKFDPMAESKKGARGLMQIMPETAKWICSKIDISFHNDTLFEPEHNIMLGCWYLANLREEFNNINLVLAAYNGGRGNVNKWIEEGLWKGEENNIDKIPFRETRDYIQKVKMNYDIYIKLYGK